MATWYTRQLPEADKSLGLRYTYQFQNPEFDLLDEALAHLKLVKLRSICARPIRRGVQPAYDEGGEVMVIKTAQLKDGHIDLSEVQYVSRAFYEKHKRRAGVTKGDILISSTGMGRGKIDYYDLDQEAIADSHIAIVSLRPDFDSRFVVHFLHTSLGKLQLKRLESLVKGTPEIYPHQLERLRVPDWPLEKQRALVTKIEQMEQQITALQTDIDRLQGEIVHTIKTALQTGEVVR